MFPISLITRECKKQLSGGACSARANWKRVALRLITGTSEMETVRDILGPSQQVFKSAAHCSARDGGHYPGPWLAPALTNGSGKKWPQFLEHEVLSVSCSWKRKCSACQRSVCKGSLSGDQGFLFWTTSANHLVLIRGQGHQQPLQHEGTISFGRLSQRGSKCYPCGSFSNSICDFTGEQYIAKLVCRGNIGIMQHNCMIQQCQAVNEHDIPVLARFLRNIWPNQPNQCQFASKRAYDYRCRYVRLFSASAASWRNDLMPLLSR
jgi:hypothetical protein